MSSMLGDLFGTLLDSMAFKFSRGQSMIKMIHFHQDWFCLFLHVDHVTWICCMDFSMFSCCSPYVVLGLMFPWVFSSRFLASRFGHPTEDGRPWKRVVFVVQDTASLTNKKWEIDSLIGGLEPWNFEWLSRNSWEWNNHPNWRTPSFFRGVGIPPTSDLSWLSCCKLIHWFHCCV